MKTKISKTKILKKVLLMTSQPSYYSKMTSKWRLKTQLKWWRKNYSFITQSLNSKLNLLLRKLHKNQKIYKLISNEDMQVLRWVRIKVHQQSLLITCQMLVLNYHLLQYSTCPHQSILSRHRLSWRVVNTRQLAHHL